MTQKSTVGQSTPTSSGASAGGTAASSDESLAPLKAGVANQAHELAQQVKHAADDVAGHARHAAETQLSSGQDRVAQGLGSVASALRKTSVQLRNDDPLGITDYVVRTADRVDAASDYFQQRTLGQLVGDIEQFARREPALFLGGAFVTGLLGGRFLRSARRPVNRGADGRGRLGTRDMAPGQNRSFAPPRQLSGPDPDQGPERGSSARPPNEKAGSFTSSSERPAGPAPSNEKALGPTLGSNEKTPGPMLGGTAPKSSATPTPGGATPGGGTKTPGGA